MHNDDFYLWGGGQGGFFVPGTIWSNRRDASEFADQAMQLMSDAKRLGIAAPENAFPGSVVYQIGSVVSIEADAMASDGGAKRHRWGLEIAPGKMVYGVIGALFLLAVGGLDWAAQHKSAKDFHAAPSCQSAVHASNGLNECSYMRGVVLDNYRSAHLTNPAVCKLTLLTNQPLQIKSHAAVPSQTVIVSRNFYTVANQFASIRAKVWHGKLVAVDHKGVASKTQFDPDTAEHNAEMLTLFDLFSFAVSVFLSIILNRRRTRQVSASAAQSDRVWSSSSGTPPPGQQETSFSVLDDYVPTRKA